MMQHIVTFAFSIGCDHSTPERPNLVRRPYGLDHWMLELTVSGKALVQSPDGEKWSFSRGDVFCYRPGISQYYELHPEAKKWNHYWICFYPTEEFLELLNWKEDFSGFHSIRIRDNTVLNRVESIFKQAIPIARSHYPHRDALMNNFLHQILLWANMENPSNTLYMLDDRIRKSLYYIDDSLARYIKIEELARIAGLSVSRFAHLFQEVMGLSPLRYLERRRMERAVELLQTTVEPISQIAHRVGYEDPLYFSRVFHRILGLSPQNYRIKTRNRSSHSTRNLSQRKQTSVR